MLHTVLYLCTMMKIYVSGIKDLTAARCYFAVPWLDLAGFRLRRNPALPSRQLRVDLVPSCCRALADFRGWRWSFQTVVWIFCWSQLKFPQQWFNKTIPHQRIWTAPWQNLVTWILVDLQHWSCKFWFNLVSQTRKFIWYFSFNRWMAQLTLSENFGIPISSWPWRSTRHQIIWYLRCFVWKAGILANVIFLRMINRAMNMQRGSNDVKMPNASVYES